MELEQTIRTPCIGVCSTGIGDSVCRGCKRFDYEVIQWNSYSQPQKAAIDHRLAALLSDTVARRFSVFDTALLASQLQLQQISYPQYRAPYCWLYELLRAGAGQIDCCEQYGFRPLPESEGVDLTTLRRAIDSEFYSLSVAHYERYIVANRVRASCVST